MKLNVQEHRTEAMAIFYGLPTNVASIRILAQGVKQYVARGSGAKAGKNASSSGDEDPCMR